MHVRGVWQRGFETTLDDGRGHSVTVDLPVDEGGTDHGTSALEMALESLAGCFVTILLLVARKRRVRIDGVSVELDGDRPRGSPTITRVHGTATIVSPADEDDVQAAVDITMRTCPVGVLFERAEIPIQVVAVVVRPPTDPGDVGTLTAPVADPA